MRSLHRPRSVAALAVVALGLAAPLSGPTAAAAPGDTTTIDILGITDFHGHIERATSSTGAVTEPGAVTLACEVAAARAANPSTLFVSNGDNVGGSAYVSSILDDDPTINILNAIGLDVTSTGNHEFDQGISDLTGDIIPSLDAPVLSANVTGDATLSAEASGNGTFVKEVDGVKVGFVGVVTDELPTLVSKSAISGLTVDNATATANARATELKSSGAADVVVVLAHEDAAVYGGQFNGDVDAVVAGHTHLPYASVVKSTAGTDIAVVQPDHYGELLGSISLTVTEQADGSKNVTASSASNIDLRTSGCTTDAYGVAGIVAQADADSQVAGSAVIANLATDFYRGTSSGTDYGANRTTESTASDLIADSFQSWLADLAPAGDHLIGLMNPGGVRADYMAGELTEGEAYTVQPFGNEMAYASYSGAQIKQVLAQQWQPTTSRAGLVLGVSSNVRVLINQDAASELENYWTQISTGAATADSLASAIADARSRVIDAVYIDGALLGDAESVVVASNTFLLAGGDNFTVLGESTMINTGILDRTATGDYLKANEPLTASYEKRQIGSSLSVDSATGATTLSLTGLLFSATAEQTAAGAAASVTVSAAMPDGSTAVAGTAPIDATVTAGLPETGRATVAITVPNGAATHTCTVDGKRTTCASLTVTVTANDGTVSALPRELEAVAKAKPGNGSGKGNAGTPGTGYGNGNGNGKGKGVGPSWKASA